MRAKWILTLSLLLSGCGEQEAPDETMDNEQAAVEEVGTEEQILETLSENTYTGIDSITSVEVLGESESEIELEVHYEQDKGNPFGINRPQIEQIVSDIHSVKLTEETDIKMIDESGEGKFSAIVYSDLSMIEY